MIASLYADNYKTLVNTTIKFGRSCLLLGENGSGKSSVLEVIRGLSLLVGHGTSLPMSFPSDSSTRWDDRQIQTFKLDIGDEQGRFQYHLEIFQDGEPEECRVTREILKSGDEVIFDALDGVVAIEEASAKAQRIVVDWHRSGVPVMLQAIGDSRIAHFRNLMADCVVVRPDPFSMEAESTFPNRGPMRSLSNFVSWYRHLAAEAPGAVEDLKYLLSESFPGLKSITLTPEGETTEHLRLEFDLGTPPGPPGGYVVSFGELSEGQRCLIALYAMLAFGVGTGSLCIDEPDNFLSTREIQPWIAEARERVGSRSGQLIVVSHHPEILDYFGVEDVLWFERDAKGVTRVGELPPLPADGLTLSELIARGWVHA